MKKIINISLLFILTALSACTDLDLAPQNDLTPDIFFTEDDAYERFLARIYAGLSVTGQEGPAGNADIKGIDEGFSEYIRQYWQLQELPTEEAVIAWKQDVGLFDLSDHSWGSANPFVRATYYRIFFQISLANEFLRESTGDKLESRGVSEEVRAQMPAFRAEARFMRALSYWHAIDLFGNIPFYTEEQAVGGSAPRQAREEVFNFLLSELQEAEGDMADPGTALYGRADRAALWMLQAKLYLNGEVYTGKPYYTECIAACNKIISSGAYSLEDIYQHSFLADNHLSQEIIFSVNFDGDATQTYGGTTYLIHASLGGNMDAEVYGVNSAWGGLRTTSALVDLFPDESGGIDERAIFYTDGQSKSIEALDEFTDGYAVPKYQNITSDGVPGSDLEFADTDYPMFRLADAYLMYAEAVLRGGQGGDEATAIDYINELRERAYNNASGNITATDLDLDFILDERARELYWEGHRRQDLIRFNLFTENGVWPWKGGVREGKTTEVFRNLYPIPANDLLANPNLDQNPGY